MSDWLLFVTGGAVGALVTHAVHLCLHPMTIPETPMWTTQSYDEHQIGAVLKACAVCGQMRYFTNHLSDVCGACRT